MHKIFSAFQDPIDLVNELFKLKLKTQFDLTIKDVYGKTPLHYAAL